MPFLTHLQARELCPQTYSLSSLLEWSQVTHIPTSMKSGGAYKSKKSAFCSFARQLCDDTCLPGWLSAFPAHSQTFKPTQASFAQIANHHIQQARKSFIVFFFVCVFVNFRPATWKYCQTTTKGCRPHQRGMPPCWFGLPPWESVTSPWISIVPNLVNYS